MGSYVDNVSGIVTFLMSYTTDFLLFSNQTYATFMELQLDVVKILAFRNKPIPVTEKWYAALSRFPLVPQYHLDSVGLLAHLYSYQVSSCLMRRVLYMALKQL